MLYNTTNGQAHNNSTTCCTTNLPHIWRKTVLTTYVIRAIGSGGFGEFDDEVGDRINEDVNANCVRGLAPIKV